MFAKKYMLEFEEVASSLCVISTKTGEIVESIIAANRSHHRHTFVSVILKEKKKRRKLEVEWDGQVNEG